MLPRSAADLTGLCAVFGMSGTPPSVPRLGEEAVREERLCEARGAPTIVSKLHAYGETAPPGRRGVN